MIYVDPDTSSSLSSWKYHWIESYWIQIFSSMVHPDNVINVEPTDIGSNLPESIKLCFVSQPDSSYGG